MLADSVCISARSYPAAEAEHVEAVESPQEVREVVGTAGVAELDQKAFDILGEVRVVVGTAVDLHCNRNLLDHGVSPWLESHCSTLWMSVHNSGLKNATPIKTTSTWTLCNRTENTTV